MPVLDSLLEGFAASTPAPAFPGSPIAPGDRVRVSVKGSKGIVGKVLRPHGTPPTHAVIQPDGASAHVLAKLEDVKLDTPAQHALARRREAAAAAKQPPAQQKGPKPIPVTVTQKMPVGEPPAKPGVLEALLGESFAPLPNAPAQTPAQSQAAVAGKVAAANASLRSGWNAAKHPRAAGGRFGYTTGGKRASRATHHSSRSSSKSSSSPRVLGLGSSGTLVKSIQRQLGLQPTGVYNAQMQQAVSRYQAQHHLQVDGVVGAQTLAALRGHVNPQRVKPGPISSKAATVTAPKVHRATASQRTAAATAARGFGGTIV